MTIKYSVDIRNAQLALIETNVLAASNPQLAFYTGSMPASAQANWSGTKIMEMDLPADIFSAPSGGVMTKTGTWQGTCAISGTASYFRLNDNTSSLTGIVQGSVGTSGADLIVDSVAFVAGQIFTVITFTITHNQG